MSSTAGKSPDKTINETVPLLGSEAYSAPNQGIENGGADSDATAELPRSDVTQISLLCAVSLAQPIAFGSILPFINQMVFETGDLPESDVGFWSGLIESLFSIAQISVLVLYARLADRLGRKPVLVFSLVALGISCILFGMTTNLVQMLLVRCLAGLVSGDAIIIRTMLAERSNKATQAKAFSWYGVAGNVGLLLGPTIGGLFARPANLYPGVFEHIQFFQDYPFALPNIITGGLSLVAAFVSFAFIKDTISHKKVSTQDEPQPLMSTWQVLKSPGVPMVMLIFGHVMTQGLIMSALLPLTLFTSIEKGGFSFSEQLIAATLIVIATSQTLAMLLLFPPLHKRFGTVSILKVCAVIWPLFTATFPIFNLFLRNGWIALFWSCAGVLWTIGPAGAMIFACVQLCVNDISPSPQVLATVNALAMTVNSAARAVIPVLFTSLFALGVRLQWANGQLVYVILVAFSCTLPILLLWLPKEIDAQPPAANETDTEQDGGSG